MRWSVGDRLFPKNKVSLQRRGSACSSSTLLCRVSFKAALRSPVSKERKVSHYLNRDHLSHCLSCPVCTLRFVPPKTHLIARWIPLMTPTGWTHGSWAFKTLTTSQGSNYLNLLTSQNCRGRKNPNKSSDVIPSTSTYTSCSTEKLHRNMRALV